MSKNFALIGVGGYVAPRHLKAIKDTGNRLISSIDKADSVGILDSYFDGASFFVEFERFDRHAEKLLRKGKKDRIHYVSICSPNYLHDAHTRFALRIGADAICEKPLVLNPWNLDAIEDLQKATGKKVYTVLQLRLHPSIINLNRKVKSNTSGKRYDIDLTYITSRGKWYFHSWKGDVSKSGGVVTNIGIHFFDMLLWIFGEMQYSEVHYSDDKKIAGYMELDKANIRWFLSLDKTDLPNVALDKNKRTYRSLTMDGKEIEFSDGFTDLHTMVYKDILEGRGFGIEDARPSIDMVYDIRNSIPVGIKSSSHPLLNTIIKKT